MRTWLPTVALTAVSVWALPVLLDSGLKGVAILALASLTALAMRQASAAARHLVWSLSMLGLLLLPVLSAVLPAWQVLPRWLVLGTHQPAAQAATVSSLPLVEPLASVEVPTAQHELAPSNQQITFNESLVPAATPPIIHDAPAVTPLVKTRPWSSWTWREWLLLIWVCGALIKLTRVVLGILTLWLLQLRSKHVNDAVWLAQLETARSRLRLRQTVALLRSRHNVMPMTWGIFWPKLLLPRDCDSWSSERCRVVLLHELAHVQRGDCLTHLLMQLAGVLHWFNPLIWLASRQIVVERERACDDLVLAAGSKASDYAEHLVQVAAGLRTEYITPAAIAMARPSTLEGRLRAILDPHRTRGALTRMSMIVAIAFTFGVLLPISAMRGRMLAAESVTKIETTAPVKLPNEQRVLQGRVIDIDGHVVQGAKVKLLGSTEADIESVSNADGTFKLTHDSARLAGLMLMAVTDDGQQQGMRDFEYDLLEIDPQGPVDIVIKKIRKVTVQVVNANGKPVADSNIEVLHHHRPIYTVKTDTSGNAHLQVAADLKAQWVVGLKAGVGFDYYENYSVWPPPKDEMLAPLPEHIRLVLDGSRSAKIQAVDSAGKPVPHVGFVPWTIKKPGKIDAVNLSGSLQRDKIGAVETDANGIALFDWLPANLAEGVTFLGSQKGFHCPEPPHVKMSGTEEMLTARLLRDARVSGKVFLRNGSPAPNILIQAEGRGETDAHYCRRFFRTDENGTYSANLYSEQSYILSIAENDWTALSHTGLYLKEGDERQDLYFFLERGTLIRGLITTGPDHKPAAQETVTLIQMVHDSPSSHHNHGYDRGELVRWVKTDQNGSYILRVASGKYKLQGPTGEPEILTVLNEEAILRDFYLEKKETRQLTGRVIDDETSAPIAGAIIESAPTDKSHSNRWGFRALTDNQGQFTAECGTEIMVVAARDPKGGRGGFALAAENINEITIRIRPAASVVGRIINSLGDPVPNNATRMQLSITIGDDTAQFGLIGDNVITDQNGKYTFPAIPVGAVCEIYLNTYGGWNKAYEVRIDKAGSITIPDQTINGRPPIRKSASRPVSNAPVSRLEFRIVPNDAGSGRDPKLTNGQQYVTDLQTNGPLAGRERGDEFQWFEIAQALGPLQTETYQQRRYTLLTGRDPYVMLTPNDGRRSWSLKRAYAMKDDTGRPAISIEFDDAGAELFAKLTEANVSNLLAILINGRIVTTATIIERLTHSVQISGSFSSGEAELVASALAAGMPPASQPANSASSRPSTQSSNIAIPAASQPAASDSLDLHVVNRDTKAPLAGAEVEVRRDRDKEKKTTDEQGRLRIDFTEKRPEYLVITAWKQGFAPMRVFWSQDHYRLGVPSIFTLALEPGTTIGGIVQDEAGAPVPDVEVKLRLSSPSVDVGHAVYAALGDRSDVKTDASGRWQCDVLPATFEHLDILLSHRDYISDTQYGQRATPPIGNLRDRTAMMVMKKGLTLTGTVRNDKGEPIAGASVSPDPNQRVVSWYQDLKTDDAGRFEFKNIRPGLAIVTVRAKGYAPSLTRLDLTTNPVPLDIHLEPGHTIRGRVVDVNGAPIQGVMVWSRNWRGYATFMNEVTTDAEGRFSIEDAPADEVLFEMNKKGYFYVWEKPITAADQETVIVMKPVLKVSGKVVDAKTGTPIERFTMVPGYTGGNFKEPNWDRMHAKVFPGSEYECVFEFPRDGHALRIEAEGYAAAESPLYTGDEGELVHDFQLERAGKAEGITGTVKDAAGKAVSGAQVALSIGPRNVYIQNGKILQNQSYPSAVTDANGAFSISPQKDMTAIVVVAEQGYAAVKKDQLTESGEIEIYPWGRIEGTMKIGAKPAVNEWANLIVDGPNDERGMLLDYKAGTDNQGHFVMDRVPAGIYRIGRQVVLNETARTSMSSFTNPVPIVVTPGDTTQVSIGGMGRPVIGRVQAPAGMNRTIDWTYGDNTLQGRPTGRYPIKLQSDGSFRIDDVAEGTYELSLRVQERPADPFAGDGVVICQLMKWVGVPGSPGGRSDEPLDLGTLTMELPNQTEAPRKKPASRPSPKVSRSHPATQSNATDPIPIRDAKPGHRWVSGIVLAEDSDKPINNALVRAIVANIDMRHIRTQLNDHAIFETHTDQNGLFRIEVPLKEKEKISLDAFAPGYQSAAGTYMGGNPSAFPFMLALGNYTNLAIRLQPGLYVAGVIVDEEGKPFSGAEVEATLQLKKGYGNISFTMSDSAGRFEIFDFPVQNDQSNSERAQLLFRNKNTLPFMIPDLYKMSADDRKSLKVTLLRGHTVNGRLLDAQGKPLAKMLVEAVPTGLGELKDDITDAEGRFSIGGLPRTLVTLRAHAMALKQKGELTIQTPVADPEVTLRLEPVVLANPPETIELLGMKVANLTPELQKLYNIHNPRGVLILDPGAKHSRLGIGQLAEGNLFWMVGEKRVSNIHQMVSELVRINEIPRPNRPGMISEGHREMIRVVFEYGGGKGSNTQYLKPTPEDAAQLKKLLATLGGPISVETAPASQPATQPR